MSNLATKLASHGLCVRGVTRTLDGEHRSATGTWVVLVGHVGGALWPHLSTSPEYHDGQPHPLDRWSQRVLTALAQELSDQELSDQAFGVEVCLPFDKPYPPFQRWAMRALGLKPSPLGILMDPAYGLWHAWRGALLFKTRPPNLPQHTPAPHPCDTCATKPCLHTCPVQAIVPQGLQPEPCLRHLDDAQTPCRRHGCQARLSCPVGRPYASVQHRFHLEAFYTGQRHSEPES